MKPPIHLFLTRLATLRAVPASPGTHSRTRYMKDRFLPALAALVALAVTSAASTRPTPHTFPLGTNDFLLDGRTFQIRAGEIHPNRIPKDYWRHRIQMAKAMGLNTIAAYIFWDHHEVKEGCRRFAQTTT